MSHRSTLNESVNESGPLFSVFYEVGPKTLHRPWKKTPQRPIPVDLTGFGEDQWRANGPLAPSIGSWRGTLDAEILGLGTFPLISTEYKVTRTLEVAVYHLELPRTQYLGGASCYGYYTNILSSLSRELTAPTTWPAVYSTGNSAGHGRCFIGLD